jgi:hypothetical protein
MLRFLTFAVSLTLAAAFVPGNALPHGAVVARASARPIMAIPERFRKGGNKVDKDLAPEDVYGDLSVDDAASKIEAVLGEKPKAKKADIKLPEVDLPEVDDVIVAAIKGSSTVMEKSKEALDAAIEFEKENDVSTKAKDAFAMAVDVRRFANSTPPRAENLRRPLPFAYLGNINSLPPLCLSLSLFAVLEAE